MVCVVFVGFVVLIGVCCCSFWVSILTRFSFLALRQVVAALNTNKYDVAIVNFANPDMVGHTGDLEAAVKAVESVDVELGKIQQR